MCLSDNLKIKEKRQKTFELYKEEYDRYISDSKKEKSIVKGYQGRELLELIQNAEDECKDRQGVMIISLEGNILKVENSGNPFSYEGILSLMTASYSPKDSNNFIGNKGLGFRAVLSWCNSVSIFSSLLSVRFSREDAIQMQDELIKAIDEDRKVKYRFNEYSIPIFSAPNTEIDYVSLSDNMDTLILLECKEEVIYRVKQQLNLINGKELLFLKNLGKIIIKQGVKDEADIFSIIDGNDYKSTNIKKLFYKECLIESSKNNETYHYIVYQTTDNLTYINDNNEDDIEKTKKYILSLAIPIDNAPSDEYLYSYFRTNIKSPFRFILNATFELTDDRKNIFDSDNENSFNNQIVSLLPNFIINSIIYNYSKNRVVNYTLLSELLINDSNFLSSNGYNFYNKYLQTLKNSKVFPSVNNEYIDFNCKPVLYEVPFAQILYGEEFNNLLQYTQDIYTINFYSTLNRYYYNQEIMSENINLFLTKINISISMRANLIKYFVEYYCIRPDKTNSFPYLLIDSYNKPIISDEFKIFNQPLDEELIKIPSFIKLRFVNRELIKELESIIPFNTDNKIRETIDKYLKYFGVFEYSFSALAHTINKTSEEDLSYQQIIELMIWVYNGYKAQKGEDLNSIKLNLKLPINNNEYLNADELYFSDKYNNYFYYKFLKKASNNVKFVADKDEIGFRKETKDNVKKYFSWLGVEYRPRKIIYDIPNEILHKYEKYLLSECCITPEKNYQSGKVWIYEYFYEILENLSNTEIINWLLDEQSDPKSIISSKNELFGSQLNYSRNLKTDNLSLKSYVRWQLGIYKWVNIDNEETQLKYSLHDCLLENIDISPYLLNPRIEYNNINKYNEEYIELKINLLLTELGIINKLTDLTLSRFYELLFILKDIDPDIKITKKIYNILFEKVKAISNDYNAFVNEESYRKFINNGLILAQIGRNREFMPVNKTYYSDKRDLCSGILKDIFILDMERRLGQEQISKVFGVKTLEQTKVEIKEFKIHTLNEYFKMLINNIKPFLIVYRKNKTKKGDFNIIKNIDITLCSHIKITYSINENPEKIYELSDYEPIFLRDSKKAYICVPDNKIKINDLRREYDFYENLSELLTIILDVNDDKEKYMNLIRDELEISERAIKDYFGDRGYELLKQARRDLGETETNEDVFWGIVSKLTNKDIIVFKSNYSPLLNYENINALENCEHIINLFKTLSIQIKTFNNYSDSTFKINIENYFDIKFKYLKETLINKYKSYIYRIIKHSNIQQKSKYFTKVIREYNFKKIENNCNNVNFNIQDEFKDLFKVTVLEIENIEEIDIEKIRENNLINYKSKNEENFTLLVKEYGSEAIKEAALYNEIDILSIIKTEPQQQTSDKVNNDNTNKIINAVLNNDVKGKETSIIEPQKKESLKDENIRRKKSNTVSPNYVEIEALKNDIGFAAELKVYTELCKKHGIENVNWVSTNAERNGVLEANKGDDNLHYDISYTDEHKKERYVEVKGTSKKNDIIIKITKPEYDFGNDEKNKDYYDIHFVIIDIENDFTPIRYHIFEEFFNLREDGRRKFELINDTFIIFAKIDEDAINN